MALTKEQIKIDYPLPAYNYRVDVAGESITFSEVSGLDRAYETVTYKESFAAEGKAGPNIMYMPAQIQAVNISMKKGLVRQKSIPKLYDWINSVEINLIDKRDIVIHLLDEKGQTVVQWTAIDAFPTKLTAPSFTADSNDVAIESLDLMALRVTMEEIS